MSTSTWPGRLVVVIGDTSGIGLALSQGPAAAGADVVPVSRRPAMVRPGYSITIEPQSLIEYWYPHGVARAQNDD